jgi:GT2 family glycosyltransferase/glycosyltransferase involved in cell wall biosynthesis
VVLFASYSGSLGGAERLLIDWATAVPGEPWLACPEGPLASAARARGLRVLPLQQRSIRLRAGLRGRVAASIALAAHASELRRLASNLDPELVVAWGMRPAVALLIGRTVRAPMAFQHNDMLPGPAIAALVRAAATRAAVVTVPSRAVASDLDPSGALAGRIQVVHPGVDLDRFSPDVSPARPAEVLVLGALVPWKRPDLALEACAIARRRGCELRLRFVGGPVEPSDDELVMALRERGARADLDGAVELSGPSGDVPAELARATCLLHCAEREPFGLAVLEALAAGRPAIIPAAGGPAEIADSSCAFLYPPGDADAAADALISVMSDHALAARMGAAGRARARAHFDGANARSRWAHAIASTRSARPSRQAAPSAIEIVTVTHNSSPAVSGLLRSLERWLPGARVVVVDCGSSDRTVATARGFRCAQVIALGENVGFARACNRAVAEVQAPVTALLNPDVELVDDSLLAAAAIAMRPEPGSRLLAPLVLSADGSRQDTVHPEPGSPADLARSLLPAGLLPAPLARPIAPWKAPSPRRVGWAVGCALVGRTETLTRLGPFDERFFLYGEDLELGLRAAQAGIETWFWPASRVLHHRAHSTRQEFGGEPFDLLARARRDAVARRLGRRRLTLDDGAQAVTFAVRIVAKRALGRPAVRERSQLSALSRAVRESRG